MAEPKDNPSFFRKVVRFVANPATDWSEVATRPDDSQELERSELKAMVERKRRNDFVRKREFDILRKLRREGLSPEQLAALGGSSKVEDSEVRLSEGIPGARIDFGVKAKIDEIEQQMVGENSPRDAAMQRRSPPPRRAQAPVPRAADFYTAPTEPVSFDAGRAASTQAPGAISHRAAEPLPSLRDSEFPGSVAPAVMGPGVAPLRRSTPLSELESGWSAPPSAPPRRPSTGRGDSHPPSPLPPLPPLDSSPYAMLGKPVPASLPQVDLSLEGNNRYPVEVGEVVHDPELDEAVIAFANADFNHCELSLIALCKPHAARHLHGETWHVLLDLYRATGQQPKFESLSIDYANLFGRSSPQWYSLPKRVAEAVADVRPDTRGVKGDVGWVSPPVLDVEAVARLRSATLQLPLPWVLDWTALAHVDVEAADHLNRLFRQWAPQPIDMRWIAADRLLTALQDAAPTGVRDADPAFWMARLEALRLSNRPDQFDEAAIDYCVTYEVSPPSWERSLCQVRAGNASVTTGTPPMANVGDASTSFYESGLLDDNHAGLQVTTVELSGQLAGDISATLQQIDHQLGSATLVHVSCARLIRVDFIAAGDLLNWVLAKHAENRSITFTDAHRLVALFFGAMGINEHARVQVPRE